MSELDRHISAGPLQRRRHHESAARPAVDGAGHGTGIECDRQQQCGKNQWPHTRRDRERTWRSARAEPALCVGQRRTRGQVDQASGDGESEPRRRMPAWASSASCRGEVFEADMRPKRRPNEVRSPAGVGRLRGSMHSTTARPAMLATPKTCIRIFGSLRSRCVRAPLHQNGETTTHTRTVRFQIGQVV